jgi:hypothetical protein
MRKILALCAALALSVVMVVPAAALSNNGVHTTVAYSVSYTDAIWGPVTCTGTHQYGKQWPGTTTTGGRDSFTCTSTSGLPVTGAAAGQVYTYAVGGWASDYAPLNGATNTIAFTVTVSLDGMSYSGVAAYYPPL